MSAVQLNFSLRTSAKCKSVHLVGSWDSYKGQLPLSKDSAKAGGWKGTFRFQGSTLKQGQRYWYYYIIDGYHVSHDPARQHVVEPTTGRKLNTLDIPAATKAATAQVSDAKQSRRVSRSAKEGVVGRALSPGRIQCPAPQRQHALARSQYSAPTIEALAAKYAAQQLDDDDDESESDSDDSDDDSDVPSLTSRSSRSSNNSTPSSVSSVSSCCTCERYGITRAGDRVKLDCGGSRCGDDSESESCASESEGEYLARSTRRHAVLVRK